MAQIDRLPEQIQLPLPDQGREWTYDFQRQLNGKLEEILSREVNVTINLILDRQGDIDTFYFAVANDDGTYDDGTWRMQVRNGALFVEKKESGSWVEYGSWGYTA